MSSRSQNAHCPPYAPGLQAWSSPSLGHGIRQAAGMAGEWVGRGLEGCVWCRFCPNSLLLAFLSGDPNYKHSRADFYFADTFCSSASLSAV